IQTAIVKKYALSTSIVCIKLLTAAEQGPSLAGGSEQSSSAFRGYSVSNLEQQTSIPRPPPRMKPVRPPCRDWYCELRIEVLVFIDATLRRLDAVLDQFKELLKPKHDQPD